MAESELEMDFDTIHGTSLTDPSKPLVLYWNRQAAVEQQKTHNRFLVRVALPFLLSIWIVLIILANLFAPPARSVDVVYPIVMAIFPPLLIIFGTISSSRKRMDDFTKTLTPVLALSAEGLSVRCPGRNFGVVPWSAVKDVKTDSCRLFLGDHEERFVRIVFSGYSAVKEYKLEDTSYAGQYYTSREEHEKWRNERCLIKRPPPKDEDYCVDIPESWLPLSAEDVVEAVRLRLVHLIDTDGGNLAIDG